MRPWARAKSPATTTKSMSKRKGRRLTSEIKSILRAPADAEGELEPSDAPGAEGASDETLEAGEAGAASDARAESSEPPEESEAPISVPPVSTGLDEYEAALDEAAAAIDRPDLGVEEADSQPDPPIEAARRGRRSRARAEAEANAVAEAIEHADAPSSDTADDYVAGGQRGAQAQPGSADDADDAEERSGAERFAESINFDDAGDDTEGFLRGLVEALLFTSQKPIDVKDLARSAGIDKPRARELIEQLRKTYEGRGLCIEEVAGGFVMRSSPRYAPYIHRILALKPVRLSRAQLETLAIVAYRQPVTKPEVDDIRGVDSGQVIKGLLERTLLKMLGKKDEPGHPTLYGTTNEFLELLNLQSLKDLPTLREYTELSDESQRKFTEATGEAAPSESMTFERPPAAGTDPDEARSNEGEANDGERDIDVAREQSASLVDGSGPADDDDENDAYAAEAVRSQSDVVPIDEAQLGEREDVADEDADDEDVDDDDDDVDDDDDDDAE